MKSSNLIFLGICFMLLILTSDKIRAEMTWQPPAQITHTDGEYVATDFDALVDQNDRIHLAFTVHRYQGERLNNRVMYQVLDKEGNPLTEPVVAVGDFQRQYRPSMVMDEAGNVHLVCPTTTEDWHSAFYYTSFDCNGNRRIDPVSIEGTMHDTISWDNTNMFSFLRRDDGLFVIASLPTSVLPGDELACSFVGYLLFDSTGTLQRPAQLLWHDNADEHNDQTRFSYSNLYATLDSDDNLCFSWRMYRADPDRIYFACVAPNGDVLTEPTVIPGEYNNNSAQAVWDIYALSIDRIFLLRVDTPDDGNPFIIYEQTISREGDVIERTPILTTVFQSTSIIRAKQIVDGKLFFAGTTLHPDSLPVRKEWNYCVSMDTLGAIVDSVEYFQKRRSFTGTIRSFLNMSDRFSAFYYQGVAHQEDAGNEYIAMTQKVDKTVNNASQDTQLQQINPFRVSVYPQPCNPGANVEISSRSASQITLNLFTFDGRIVGSHQIHTSSTGRASFQLSSLFQENSLCTGTYYLSTSIPNQGKKIIPVSIIK